MNFQRFQRKLICSLQCQRYHDQFLINRRRNQNFLPVEQHSDRQSTHFLTGYWSILVPKQETWTEPRYCFENLFCYLTAMTNDTDHTTEVNFNKRFLKIMGVVWDHKLFNKNISVDKENYDDASRDGCMWIFIRNEYLFSSSSLIGLKLNTDWILLVVNWTQKLNIEITYNSGF